MISKEQINLISYQTGTYSAIALLVLMLISIWIVELGHKIITTVIVVIVTAGILHYFTRPSNS